MILALAIILLIFALAGGVFVHPLLFLIAVLAVLVFVAPHFGRRW